MQSRGFKCKNCGCEKHFNYGLAMLAPAEAWDEEEKLQEELKNEVLSGKYGSKLKQYAELMKEKVYFDTKKDIFQCGKCYALLIHRRKDIGLCWDSKRLYEQRTIIIQSCPHCGDDSFFEPLDSIYPICPECHHEMECLYIGRD